MAAYRLPGLWLTTSAGWLPRTRIISGTLHSVIEYGLPFTYDMAFWACLVGSVVEAVYRLASALIVTSSVCWFACGAGHRYIELSTSVGFRRWELNVCCINVTQCVCVWLILTLIYWLGVQASLYARPANGRICIPLEYIFGCSSSWTVAGSFAVVTGECGVLE